VRTSSRSQIEANVARGLGKALASREINFRRRHTKHAKRKSDAPQPALSEVEWVRAAYLGDKLGDTSALENPASLEIQCVA